jgi:V8-like Glu-specific endopeptidase
MTYTIDTSVATAPFNCVCYVTDTVDGVNYRASGVIIGPHTVLTAAHVVWDATSGDTATNIEIYPGYSSAFFAPTSVNAVPGAFSVHFNPVSDQDGELSGYASAYDVAVIDTSYTFSSWVGVQTNATATAVAATGYPAYPNGTTGFQSHQQWTATGTVSTDPESGAIQFNTLAVSAGASGGPVWYLNGTTPDVIGVVSTTGHAAPMSTTNYQTIENWIAADSSLWLTQPAPTAAVTSFVSQQNTVRQAQGFHTDLDVAGIASQTGTNSVIGWESANLHTGNNVVVLGGPHSEYAVQVDATGQLVVLDVSTGQSTSGESIVVDNATYVVFDGGATNASGALQAVMVIAGGTNGQDAELARLYQASFGRIPDLPGLDYWKGELDSGALTMAQIAQQFAGSSEFAALYGANATNTQYVDALYLNVLGRAPDSGGLTYWVDALNGNVQSRSAMLISFASSQECVADTNSWLADTSKGGYADSGALLDAGTVLNQAEQTHYLNTNLIDPNSLPAAGAYSENYDLFVSGYELSANESFLEIDDSNALVILNPKIAYAYVYGGGDQVYATSSTISISIDGVAGSACTVNLAASSKTAVYFDGTCGATINGFVSGNNVVVDTLHAYLFGNPTVILEAGSGQAIYGANLNFNTTMYVLRLGSVNSGSAADVATAVNQVYTLAELPATTVGTQENLEIVGQTSSGNTVIYDFGNGWKNPDTNGNHLVDAAELTYQATLVGVTTSALVVHDLA